MNFCTYAKWLTFGKTVNNRLSARRTSNTILQVIVDMIYRFFDFIKNVNRYTLVFHRETEKKNHFILWL